MSDMKLDKWIERIYGETDFGANIAIGAAGGAGLAMYLYGQDVAVAGFVAIIAFPTVKVLASAAHSNWNESREQRRTRHQLEKLFDNLGREEKAVVQAFVWHGGSVIRWAECNRSQHFSSAGIESLMNRGLVREAVTADGMKETFVLDTELFDYAQEVLSQGLSDQ